MPNETEPTEVAKLLHGDAANVETHDQPEAVELPAGTLIATEPAEANDVPTAK